MNKEKLASIGELEPFINHASQLAALDYIVSVESDIFIPTDSGNMARAVEGHRRFLEHRKAISPDRRTLVRIFDKIDQGTMKGGEEICPIALLKSTGGGKDHQERGKGQFQVQRGQIGSVQRRHFM